MNAENEQSAPDPISPNAYLQHHGPMGFMIVRLNRYAVLGWVFGFSLLFFFSLYFLIDKLQPVPVLAVDSAGRVLGTFEYLDPAARTDEEILSASKYFLDRYLSLNSATIYNDYSAALSMMTQTLREEKLNEVKTTGYLARIEDAHSHSFNDYEGGRDKVAIISKSGHLVAVRLRGNMVVTPENGKTFERPFDITLEMKVVARNSFVTAGIEITQITGN